MLTTLQVAFLEPAISKDEVLTSLHHIGAKTGKAFTTNGHIARIVTHAAELTDHYVAVHPDLTPKKDAAQPPDIDAVLRHSTAETQTIKLDEHFAQDLITLCEATKALTKRFAKLWRAEPKKTRADSAPQACVVLRGNAYGIKVEITTRAEGSPLRTTLTTAPCQWFEAGFDADYLSDALEDVLSVTPRNEPIKVVMPLGKVFGPALFSDPTGAFTALVMPWRI